MSGILLRWLNEDLILKQRVLNLEHDFSNGYLLGEILHIHNHQHNFHLFQEFDTSEAKVNNFILLEPSLRLLGVPFDAQAAYNIMQGTPGMVTRLLYQVKMVLDRLIKFSVPVSMRPSTDPAAVKPLPNLPQRATKPQYDRATHTIFAAAVRDMVQSQKGINLDRSLQRFEAEGARQKRIVELDKERSLLAEELYTEAIRMQGIHDLAQRKALCDSWEENNIDEWLVNMGRQRDRQLRDHLFRCRVKRAHRSSLQRARIAGKRAVQYDLPDFEARSREASRTANGNQEEHEATPWAFAASSRGFLEARGLEKGYEWQMAKFHSKRSEERTGAREKRRRRFTTEREESQSHEHLQAGTDALKQKLMKRCHAEELVERQLDSVFRYKAIITENREYRTQQYAARADVDAEGLLKRDQASLDSFRREYELGVRAQTERCEAAAAMMAASAATRVEKMCRETLEGIFALSMEVVRYRTFNEHRRELHATAPDQDPMPSLQWTDLKRSFIRGGPLLRMDAANDVAVKEWGWSSLLPLAVSESGTDAFCVPSPDDGAGETVARFLDDSELQDFISETGWWGKWTRKSEALAPTEEVEVVEAEPETILCGNDDGATVPTAQSEHVVGPLSVAGVENILNTADPLHGLGECVIETTLAADPLPLPQPPPEVPKFSLRICMCGRTLTGKSEQAIRLAERYCLKVLSAEELAQKAMDQAANAMAAGRKTLSREEALGQEASSALLKGGTISDKVYAALVVEGIKEIEEENVTARAEANESSDMHGIMSSDCDRAEYMGWIIDDFPATAQQAAVLEKHLTGYDETAHVPTRIDAASKLAPASPTSWPARDKDIPASGIDLAIFIDVPRDTILKRSLGRLYDPVTDESYHFEGSLPQYDVVCKERLVHPEDPANASAQLSLQVSTQEQTSEHLKAFLNKFGTLRVVDSGESTPDALFGKLNAVVVAMVREAQDAETSTATDGGSAVHDGHQHEDAGSTSGVLDEPDITDSNDQATADGTTNDKSTFDEPQPREETGPEESAYDTLASTTQSVDNSQGQGQGGGLLAGCFAISLAGHWRVAELQFEDTARRVFRELRNQRMLIGVHVRSLRDSFSAFLQRSDDKQSVLVEFCSCFNSMEQDLRFDDRACKELLLRTEECRSKLWFDVEARRARATEVLRTMEGDGWVERQQGMVFNHMILLMQIEIERFHAGMLLLHDYHQAKVQEVANDTTVVLTPLLPPEVQGGALPKETPTPKSAGKKDKEGKGGGKKGQDGKGGKGSKGEPSGDSPSSGVDRTAFPPSIALASLVDVIASGNVPQAAVEVDESIGNAAQGKGKVDKTKKQPKKPSSKVEVVEAEEFQTPLARALSAVTAYADTWGPRGFPVPSEEHFDSSQADDDSATASATTDMVHQAAPPKPLLLHRAVWAQADVLTSRCKLLLRVGETLSEEIRKKADLVFEELLHGLEGRVLAEQQAVEAAMAMAKECIDTHSAIEHEWAIQGGAFRVDESFRLVPLPTSNVSRPDIAEDMGVFSKTQVCRLQDALASIQHVGMEGPEHAVVMPEDVVDVLLRLSAEEGALPDDWANASKTDLMQVVTGFLDPKGTGQVELEKVLSTVTSKTPGELLSA